MTDLGLFGQEFHQYSRKETVQEDRKSPSYLWVKPIKSSSQLLFGKEKSNEKLKVYT